MRNIIKIAVAVLIMAAAVPMRAQEWEKVNDTTYVRRFEQSTGTLTEYANPVDMAALTAKLNNDMRSAALCQAGAFGCGFAAVAAGSGLHSRRTRGDGHSSRVEAKNPALLSNRDGYLLELTGWTQGSQAS